MVRGPVRDPLSTLSSSSCRRTRRGGGLEVCACTEPTSRRRDVTTVDFVRSLTTPLRTAWEIARSSRLRPPSRCWTAWCGPAISAPGRPCASRRQPGSVARQPRGDGSAAGRRRSASPPESWVRVACARAGLPAPVPQFVVLEAGEFLGCVDLAWPEARLIVEYEGAYHFEGLQIARTTSATRRLVAAGWRVIRLSAPTCATWRPWSLGSPRALGCRRLLSAGLYVPKARRDDDGRRPGDGVRRAGVGRPT